MYHIATPRDRRVCGMVVWYHTLGHKNNNLRHHYFKVKLFCFSTSLKLKYPQFPRERTFFLPAVLSLSFSRTNSDTACTHIKAFPVRQALNAHTRRHVITIILVNWFPTYPFGILFFLLLDNFFVFVD
jgi:hypothetical protein